MKFDSRMGVNTKVKIVRKGFQKSKGLNFLLMPVIENIDESFLMFLK
jgi:hypothetical protein